MEPNATSAPSPEERQSNTPPHSPHDAGLFGNPPQDAEPDRSIPTSAAPLGTNPQDAEAFRTLPSAADAIGNVPSAADDLRTTPTPAEFQGDRHESVTRESESADELRTTIDRGDSAAAERARRETYVLTVRDAMRLFEEQGVPRCERTISQWCRPNRHGERRLEAYYDEGERRYRITEASVLRAIAEERAKTDTSDRGVPDAPVREKPAPDSRQAGGREANTELETLKAENLNLRIDNSAKEQVIAQFARERKDLLERAQAASHRIGSLETELRLLGRGSDTDGQEGAPVDNSGASAPRPW